jgi:hypothetical protein
MQRCLGPAPEVRLHFTRPPNRMRVPGWPAWPHTARPARGEPGRHSASALLPRGGAHQARPAWVTIIHGPQDTLSLHINTDVRHGHWRGGASICRERGGGNLALSPTCMGTTMRDDDWIEIYDFNSETLTLHYGCKEGTYREFKIKVIDNKLYFPLNFRGQTASEAGSKSPVTRFVRLSTCREAPQKV